MRSITLTVNDTRITANVEPRTHLADFLREQLNLTGTHLGCEHGICGACTLTIDGVPARSCITLAVACDGATITTIEGHDDDAVMESLRAGFTREHALQCGFCTPGMLVSARDVVLRMPNATEPEIRVAMSGNLCRCTGYVGIVRAIQGVLNDRKAKGFVVPPQRKGIGPAGSGHAASLTPALQPPTRLASERQEAAPLPSLGQRPVRFTPQNEMQQSFTIQQPLEQVWNLFGNLPAITSCLPGASVLAQPSETEVLTRIKVKVGPMAADFQGSAEVTRDAQRRTGLIQGTAKDSASGSTTRGQIRYTLFDDGGGSTRVVVDIGFTILGPLAQFGRSGIVKDIAGRMTEIFADNVRARLVSGGQPTGAHSELNAVRLVLSVFWQRVRKVLRWR